MNPFLLEVINCPECFGELRLTKEEVLVCLSCKKGYPVSHGVPDLRSTSAIPLKSKKQDMPAKKIIRVSKGTDSFESYLDPFTCRLVGRLAQDDQGTQIINAQGLMPLDDGLKKVVSAYIQKQNKQKTKQLTDRGFERLPDLKLSDPGVSRMHAMLFFDGDQVGVLDLVSRNGTYINGREIESAYLAASDTITLGESSICIL